MDWEELSRRKILAGIASAGGTGVVVGQGTVALFSDEETFTNNAIKASNNVAGVVDINVEISESDGPGVVFEVSLPTDSDKEDINNNPSHVWVRSIKCPNPTSANNLDAQLVLECNGTDNILDGESDGKRLGDIITNLSDGTILSCTTGSSDPQDCLEPGETRRLKLKLLEDPSNELSSDQTITFDLKFFAQQCRYNTEPDRMEPPFTGTGPDSCSPPPTPGRPFCLFPCPADSFTDLSTPLAFDNTKLPSEFELFGDKRLSFIALCGPDGIDSGAVTLHVTARNEDGEPTRVYWEVDSGTSVEQVTWKFGTTTRKKVFPDGATSGTVVTDPNAGQPGPSSPSNFCSRSGTSGVKYDSIGQNNAGDQLPRLTQQLNEIDGINLTSEVLNRDELTEIGSVRAQDSTGDIDESRTAIVGPTAGEDVIDAGGGNVTVSSYGAIVGTITNTGGNDVVIKNDGAVAGDIGIEVTDESGKTLKGTGNVKIKTRATVVGDIVTNIDGKNIKVINGEEGDRSEVLGDARTSSGGNVEIKGYGRVSGTVETDDGGNVKIKSNSRVEGDALTSGGGKIQVGNSGPSQVRGTADSTGGGTGGDIVVDGSQGDRDPSEGTPRKPAKVFGGVRAGGQANLQDANVKNGVEAKGDCDIDNSVVCGDVVSDGGNIDIDNFSIIQDGDIRGNSVTDEKLAPGEEEGAGDAEAAQTIGGVQNSFVGGDVVAESGDIDIPSSVICGDVVAKEGAVDIDSGKTGPPKPLGGEDEPDVAPTALDLPRDEVRRRSLIGGVVRVDAEDCDIAGATVFADGTTETDTLDDSLAVLVTQQASGGNDLTITDDDAGELEAIIKGNVVVNGQLNVDIDNGSSIEGRVKANAGTVSLSDVTITGPDANAVDDDAVIIGDGGKIDQLDSNATIEGNVRVKSGGTLDVSGSATIEGDLIVESGGTANRGSVTVAGDVIRQ